MPLSTPPVVSGAKPLVGHLQEFAENNYALISRGYEEQGAIFTLKMPAGRRMAILHSPDYIQKFFELTDQGLSISKGLKFVKPLVGDSGVIGGPETYNRERPVIYESFKHKKMPSHVRAMHVETMRWLVGLADHGELELQDHMVKLTQQVASLAFFGEEFKEKAGPTFWKSFTTIGDSMDFVLPPWLPLKKFRERDKAKKVIYKMVEEIIDQRKGKGHLYNDFLQNLIDTPQADGTKMTTEGTANTVVGLAFAGHETTSIQGSWTILQLLQNPEYLERVVQEVDEHAPLGTEITLEVLAKLEHVYWAIEETTRMHPSGELVQRVTEKEIEIGGYRIPNNWTVLIPAGLVQKMPELFSNPEQYDPYRFAPGREEHKHHAHAISGFGGLSHKCAGMNFAKNEMATIIALMVQQYHWELASNPQRQPRSGTARITESKVRFKKRVPGERKPSTVKAAEYPAEVLAACPHLAEKAKLEQAEA